MTGKRSFWRSPVSWLLIGLPLLSVVAGIGLVIVAARTGGNDVAIDHVQRVAQIQTTDLGPDYMARKLKLTAVARIEDGVIEVLPASGEFARDQPLRLTVVHPAQSAEDRTYELAPSAYGWRAEAALDPSHDWILRLAPEGAAWRLHGRLPRDQHAARLGPSLATP